MTHTLEIELQHFLLGPPENFAELGVDLEKASAARVYKSDADWRSLIYRSESALALFQRLVRSFTLCDVLQHARHPVDPTRPFDGKVRDEQVPHPATGSCIAFRIARSCPGSTHPAFP